MRSPMRRGASARLFLVLAAYAAVWTLYGVIAKACQDMQIDAAEIMVWSSATSLTMTFQLIASAAMPAGSSNATATTMARFAAAVA